MDGQTLDRLLDYSARSFGDRIAAAEPGARDISYDELNQLAGKISGFLQSRGVTRGDRVGIQLPKSIASLAAIFGVLRAGAAYVPVDSTAPRSRNAFIFSDCAVKFVILRSQDLAGPNSPYAAPVALDVVDPSLSGCVLAQGPAGVSPGVDVPAGLAYILYHVGLDRIAKGRDAHARECAGVHQLELSDLSARRTRQLLISRPVSFRLVHPRHLPVDQARRKTRAHFRGRWPQSQGTGLADRQGANIGLVLNSFDPQAATGSQGDRAIRSFKPPHRVVCRRGISSEAPAPTDDDLAKATVLQPVRADGNERMHLLRIARKILAGAFFWRAHRKGLFR